MTSTAPRACSLRTAARIILWRHAPMVLALLKIALAVAALAATLLLQACGGAGLEAEDDLGPDLTCAAGQREHAPERMPAPRSAASAPAPGCATQ